MTWGGFWSGKAPDIDDTRRWGRGCGRRCRLRGTSSTTTAPAETAEAADCAFGRRDAVVHDDDAVPVSRTAIERRDGCARRRVKDTHVTTLSVIGVHQPTRVERSVASHRVLPGVFQLVIFSESP